MAANVHETEIRKYIATVHYEGGVPLDTQLVLLGFFNRSGSNLLAEYLRSLPGLTGFGEYLNHPTVINRCTKEGIDSFPDYIRSLAERAGTPGFGLKASGSQVEMLHKWNILPMFRSVRAVHMVRQDIVSQAVSLWIARHTKQWTSTQSSAVSEREVPYDAAAIGRIIRNIGLQNTRIMAAFSVLDIPARTVVYERLIDEPQAEMEALGEFLELDLRDWRVPHELHHERQESSTKKDFVEQARRDLPSNW